MTAFFFGVNTPDAATHYKPTCSNALLPWWHWPLAILVDRREHSSKPLVWLVTLVRHFPAPPFLFVSLEFLSPKLSGAKFLNAHPCTCATIPLFATFCPFILRCVNDGWCPVSCGWSILLDLLFVMSLIFFFVCVCWVSLWMGRIVFQRLCRSLLFMCL